MKKLEKILLLPILVFSITALLSVYFINPASAQFDPNNLIDDSVFSNYNSMSAASIDSFLNNNFPSSCISTNNGFSAPTPTGYSPSTGFTFGTDTSAGNIIYDAAQAYQINPQVILATLEKEQTLVSGSTGCSTLQYTGAMGNDCPDGGTTYNYSGFELYSINGTPVDSVSGTCVDNQASAGFSEQVISAAWKLKFMQERSDGNVNWAIVNSQWDNLDDPSTCFYPYMTSGYRQGAETGTTACTTPTYYDGYATIDGTSVFISNGATGALYTYTPHLPGNENFVNIFTQWFGPTTGEGYTLATSYDSNGDSRQWVIYHGMRQLVPDTQTLVAWGLQNVQLMQWSGTYLGSFPINPLPLTRLMRPDGSLNVYFVDSGKAYLIPNPQMLNAWNFNPAAINDVSTYLAQLPVYSGDLTYSVQSSVAGSNVYMVDGGSIRPYASSNIQAAWEGDNAGVTTLSSDYISAMGQGSEITSNKISDGTQTYLVDNGQKLPATSQVAQLYPGSITSVSSATINRLNTGQQASQFIVQYGSTGVYLVDNSTKYGIPTPSILSAWAGNTNPNVTYVDQGFLNLLNTGSMLNTDEANSNGQIYLMNGTNALPIPSSLDATYNTPNGTFSVSSALMSMYASSSTATYILKAFNSPTVYVLDNGTLHPIFSPNDLQLWDNENTNNITSVNSIALSQFNVGYPIGSFITDNTNNYLIANGAKRLVSNQVATNWGLANPVYISDNTLNNIPTGSNLNDHFQFDGNYYMVSGGVAYMTVDPNIASEWGIGSGSPVLDPAAVNEYLQLNMLTRFVRSSLPGDTRLFIANNGVLYYLSPYQASNLGLVAGMPMAAVNPGLITPNITDWTAVMVQDASGKDYVINAGQKMLFPNQGTINYWTNDGTYTPPVVTNGFLNLLPTSTNTIERGIIGSSPAAYDVLGGVKHWILSPTTESLYAPIQPVSDSLINSLPSGYDL